MATYNSDRIRKGLPRVAAGPAWPDVANAVLADAAAAPASAEAAIAAPAPAAPAPAAAADPAPTVATAGVSPRRGLPRVAGGEPWPPGGTALVTAAPPADPARAAAVIAAPAAVASTPAAPAAVAAAPAAPAATAATAATTGLVTETAEVSLRRGLPRTAGGDPWPPSATIMIERQVAPIEASQAAVQNEPQAAAPPVPPAAPAAPAAQPAPAMEPAVAEQVAAAPIPQTPAQPTGVKPQAPAKKREPRTVHGRTLGQWAKFAVLWGGGAIFAAAIIVLAARGVTTLPGVPEFLKRYPGEYHLPEFVDPGFPAWARWSHFLNFFLMVLIIRSGMLVRHQQKPDAFFTPKKAGKKISIHLWLHTSLDLLWLANGVVFVVLLFASGHWARIVPTSWEVFPNAASAALQYLTLQWPIEDGWVNYNSLQQIMYFTVVFIAAPLATVTGVRMSEWWPKDAEKLNKLYPAPVARAIHFPVMLFFSLFILVHVFLVFTTGALKNLNHMFVGTPEPSWLGFWMFALGLLVTAAATWAARPLVLAPIAGLFGRVSER